MTRGRISLVPFALLMQSHVLKGANAFTKTEDDVTLLAPAKGHKCTPGHDISEEDCIAAATLVGGELRDGNIVVGNWADTPPGCFLEASDKTIHYGLNPGSINNGRFQPVCVTPAEEATLLQAGVDMKCTPGHDFLKEDCAVAGLSVGGNLRDGEMLIGEWEYTPFGCFLGEDKAIHFGTNVDGKNIGNIQPVCKTALDEARLLPAPWNGAKCKIGHDFPQDSCAEGALSVGGKLRNGAIIVGDYPDSPPGCFLEPSDKGVHYNTNADGVNNGQFQPVCLVGELKAALVPAGQGTKCKPELEISKEDCVAAASSVGGTLRNGKFRVGDWDRTPSGCFVQKSDKAIHWGRNPNSVNNGQFEPVCIAEEVEAIIIPNLHEGTQCTPGYDFTIEECILAGTAVGGKLRKRKFLVGDWEHTPSGCFLQFNDKAIHFGTNPNSRNNGYFLPVCKPGPIEATLLPAGQGAKCADDHDFSKEECVTAGKIVGGILRDGKFTVGEWSNAPYGCFIDPSDNAIHYGSEMGGVNIGAFQPVCKTAAHEAALLPAQPGNACEEGRDFTQEDCIVAATSVGGRLRRGKFLLGDWSHTPRGCFIEAKDNAIHYSSNVDGVNMGFYQPVCMY